MQIGIMDGTVVRPTLEGTLDAILAYGIFTVQFNLGRAGLTELPERIDTGLCDRIRTAFDARNMTMAAVSGTFNMIHPDLQKRQAGLRGLGALASACDRLGTSVITLCTGTRDPDSMWRRHPDNDSPEAWIDLVASMRQAVQIAETYGVTLAFEPEVANVVDSPRKARRLLDEMRSPYLKVTIDGANIFHAGELPRMREILDEAFALVGQDVALAHAKDLDRDGQAGHLAAGKGLLDYEHYLSLLNKLEFDVPVILHGLTESELPASLAFVRTKMQAIAPAPQPADRSAIQPPTAFPEPGVYDRAPIITLLSALPEAEIHYTIDGSLPTASSPLFDPYRLIPLEEFGEPVPEGKRTYAIRAIAQVGERTSEARTFAYEIEPRGRDEYISQELAPGLRGIRDFDNDKMYLITGSQRALLIDAGMGGGDLRGYVESFTGDLPLDLFITHGHPDHIARMGQFQADCDVYMHLDDLPLAQQFAERPGFDIDLQRVKDVREGFVFDLGDRRLQVYHVPGHSKGCLVLLDEGNGALFSGDALGSNGPTIVDALWLQRSDDRVDEYLSTLQVFRSKVAGKIKRIYGGHGADWLEGEAYLDHLQEAAQRLVDQGVDALTPSPRPSGVWQVVSGDRLSDPNWAAINVNRDRCLAAPPDQIASLSNLQLKGGSLSEAFKPSRFTYTADLDPGVSQIEIVPTATSRRYAALKIDGVEAQSGQPFAIWLKDKATSTAFLIEVVSPDRSTICAYTVQVRIKT